MQREEKTPAVHVRGWMGIGLVLIATSLLYMPALNNGFTNWDDDRQVTGNMGIRDLSLQGIERMFSTFTVALYQPLTSLTFALEYRLFGLDPRAFHAVNILLHLVNILLVYVFVRSLLQAVPIAIAAAALFAVHPLQVEVAAWVSCLSILLSSMFYLSAMIFYVTYARSGRVRYFIAVLVFFLLAILAKTSAATLPLVLLAIDFYLRRRGLLRVLMEKVPLLVLSVVFGSITLFARSGASHIQDFALRYSPVQRICVACYSLLWYPAKLLCPIGLSAFYPFPTRTADGWLPVLFYMAPAAFVGLVAGVWYAGRTRRLLVFGSLFVLASLLLVVQVVPISELMVCDRYAYLPCVGLFLLAGALGLKIGSRNRLSKMATLACAGLVVVLLGVATFQRIPIWHDSLTLWNDVIEKHQDIWAAHLNRAMARSQVGDYGAAISDLDAALQLNPGSAQALNNRAGCHTYLKNWPAALRDFDRAIELKPDSDYFINRGILKQKMGDAAGALKDFDAVLEINPSNIRALSEKADTCRLSGSWSRAIEGYETILKLDPTHSYAAFWLGAVCFEVGQYEKAAVMLEKAISLNCGDPRAAYFLLGNAYQKLGRTDRAADAFRKSREMAGAKATAEQ